MNYWLFFGILCVLLCELIVDVWLFVDWVRMLGGLLGILWGFILGYYGGVDLIWIWC